MSLGLEAQERYPFLPLTFLWGELSHLTTSVYERGWEVGFLAGRHVPSYKAFTVEDGKNRFQ